MEITLGGLPVKTTATTPNRVSMLLWGSAGTGKTTLAATAPGRKLWLSFDPDGTASLTGRDDILIVDLANERPNLVEKFKSEDPYQLSKFIVEHNIETLVFDSITNFAHKAVEHAVPQCKNATMERPSLAGYGMRNSYTLQAVKNILKMTGKAGINVIFIAHEDSPVTNDDGVVLLITVMLGGKLPEQVPLDLSEVWYMSEGLGGKRKIAIRPVRSRKPMKTRMFVTNGEPEYDWVYDADTQKGDGIKEWIKMWRQANAKIPLPGSAAYSSIRKSLDK